MGHGAVTSCFPHVRHRFIACDSSILHPQGCSVPSHQNGDNTRCLKYLLWPSDGYEEPRGQFAQAARVRSLLQPSVVTKGPRSWPSLGRPWLSEKMELNQRYPS